jgi:hypothetical protein
MEEASLPARGGVAPGAAQAPPPQQGQPRRRQQQQPGPQEGQQQQQITAKVDLLTLQGRAGKLLHLTRLYAKSAHYARAAPAAPRDEEQTCLLYLSNNPDGLPEPFEQAPLFTDDELHVLLESSDPANAELGRVKAENLNWSKADLVLRWVRARGLDRATRTLRNMADLIKRAEGKEVTRQRPAQQPQGKVRGQPQHPPPPQPPSHQQQQEQQQEQQQQGRRSQNASPVTPHVSSNGRKSGGGQQGQSGGTPPSAGAPSPAFAWSAFQNSPDPKSLPVPSFLVKVSSKFGIPLPPPPPPQVVSAAEQAAMDEALGEADEYSPAPSPRQPARGRRSSNSTGSGPPSKNKDRRRASQTIAPSPIRGSSQLAGTPESGQQHVQNDAPRSAHRGDAGPSANAEATIALRQALGLVERG